MNKLLTLVLSTLATYRITKLIVSDEITAPLREKVFNHVGGPEESRLAYLISCPHCVSVYAATLVSSSRIVAPNSKILHLVIEALAVSAVTGIIAEREDSF